MVGRQGAGEAEAAGVILREALSLPTAARDGREHLRRLRLLHLPSASLHHKLPEMVALHVGEVGERPEAQEEGVVPLLVVRGLQSQQIGHLVVVSRQKMKPRIKTVKSLPVWTPARRFLYLVNRSYDPGNSQF